MGFSPKRTSFSTPAVGGSFVTTFPSWTKAVSLNTRAMSGYHRRGTSDLSKPVDTPATSQDYTADWGQFLPQPDKDCAAHAFIGGGRVTYTPSWFTTPNIPALHHASRLASTTCTSGEPHIECSRTIELSSPSSRISCPHPHGAFILEVTRATSHTRGSRVSSGCRYSISSLRAARRGSA